MSYGINGDMSFEEFAKFIADNKSKFVPELSNDKNSVLLWVDKNGYRPNAVFEALFNTAANKATKDEEGNEVPPTKAVLIFCQCKSEIHTFITAINVVAEMYGIRPGDYSLILSKIDSYINWAISELDSQLKDNQIKTNQSTVETNKYLKTNNDFLATIFKWTIFLTICSIVISGASLFVAILTNAREQRKEEREVKQIKVNPQPQLENVETNLLKKQNDSLKSILINLTKQRMPSK
jgi:large-conductance mechanosensitive channel